MLCKMDAGDLLLMTSALKEEDYQFQVNTQKQLTPDVQRWAGIWVLFANFFFLIVSSVPQPGLGFIQQRLTLNFRSSSFYFRNTWNARYGPPDWASAVLGKELKAFCALGMHLTNWAIAQPLSYSLRCTSCRAKWKASAFRKSSFKTSGIAP